MKRSTSRRRFLATTLAGAPLLMGVGSQADEPAEKHSQTIEAGDLRAVFRDNSKSPEILSGVDALFNLKHAPDFDAYDPDSKGASAGMNFEHIISGHHHENNSFTPRRGKFAMTVDGAGVTLTRNKDDDPWAMSSTLKYVVTPPYYIDVDFRCVPHDRRLFGERNHAILFFANYMNDVEDVALHFLGVDRAGGAEKWIRADAPAGPADWNGGGTYRSVRADDLAYDAGQKFRLNSWSYDYPRFTRPFYFGKAAHGMTLALMFDRTHAADEEVRFSLFKFKLPKFPRPAWDFQYVIKNIQEGKEYGFRSRLLWTRFVSAEHCLAEYEKWSASLR